MSKVLPLVTAEALFELPADGLRHELVKGELRTMPPAGSEHGSVGMNLAGPLNYYVKMHRLGVVFMAETGFVLSRNPDTVRAPDISFIAKAKVPASGVPKTFWPGAPDLAVEVVSPNDRVYEIDEKVEDWLEAGTSLVWVVNPRRRTVTVYRPGENPLVLDKAATLDGLDVVPGFQCRVSDIFT
jgi:Uma2 family endonuclease